MNSPRILALYVKSVDVINMNQTGRILRDVLVGAEPEMNFHVTAPERAVIIEREYFGETHCRS